MMEDDRRVTEDEVTSLELTIGDHIAMAFLKKLLPVNHHLEIVDIAEELSTLMLEHADKGMPTYYQTGESALDEVRRKIKTVGDAELQSDWIALILRDALKDMIWFPTCYTPDAIDSWYSRLE